MTIKERNALIIESVVLTEEELKEAITEGKRKKFFKDKHKDHWICTVNVEGSQKIVKPGSVPPVGTSDVKQKPCS